MKRGSDLIKTVSESFKLDVFLERKYFLFEIVENLPKTAYT